MNIPKPLGRALVARLLTKRLPRSIQKQLSSDEEIVRLLEPVHRNAFALSGVGVVLPENLLGAARRALAGDGVQHLSTMNGVKFEIRDQDRRVKIVKIEGGETPGEMYFDDLAILSPDAERRGQAVRHLVESFGPTGPDYTSLVQGSKVRPLSDREALDLLRETSTGVSAWHSRIRAAFARDQVSLADIVPDSQEYFERFCGPIPEIDDPEGYLTRVLPEYRQRLLMRSLNGGLEVCLLGALRADLSPSQWTAGASDEDMWTAFSVSSPRRDPFSLLAALEIALDRPHVPRFVAFAQEAVALLLNEKFERPDGGDFYEMFPVLTELVWSQIRSMPGHAVWPPFWKRMCVWMHSLFLASVSGSMSLDLDALKQLGEQQESLAGALSELLDLHREPLYFAARPTPQGIRLEVIARLGLIKAKLDGFGRAVPLGSQIDLVSAKYGAILSMPGPLEGYLCPMITSRRKLSESESAQVLNDIEKESHLRLWTVLAGMSQFTVFPPEILDALRAVIGRIHLVDGWHLAESNVKLEKLAFIALAHRDSELAERIAILVIARAPHVANDQECRAIMSVVLLVAGAFADPNLRDEWLEGKLFDLAKALPSGDPSRRLHLDLMALRQLLPWDRQVTRRAERISGSAY